MLKSTRILSLAVSPILAHILGLLRFRWMHILAGLLSVAGRAVFAHHGAFVLVRVERIFNFFFKAEFANFTPLTMN